MWSVVASILHVAFAAASIVSNSKPLSGNKVVYLCGPADILDSWESAFNLDVWDTQKGTDEEKCIHAHVSSLGYAKLKHAASTVATCSLKVVDEDVGQTVERHMASVYTMNILLQGKDLPNELDWFKNYHPFEEIVDWIVDLSNSHSERVRLVPSIGKSHEGRDIMALHINRTPAHNGKKQIWIQGLIHAREWISGAVVQYIIHTLATAPLGALGAAVDQVEFIVIPVVNPDGYVFSWTTNRLWRKNRSPDMFSAGVDLNRNFDDHWKKGPSFPFSDAYQGPGPASEPETRAVQEYYGQLDSIVGALDMHSFSQLVLYPFGWTRAEPSNADGYKALGKIVADAMAKPGLNLKAKNQTAEYKVMQSSELYIAAGTACDWFSGSALSQWPSKKFTPYSLTIELPPAATSSYNGFLLDPSYILPASRNSMQAIRVFTKYAVANAPTRGYD